MKNYAFKKAAELPSINELPDPFLKPDGSRVGSVEEWDEQRVYLKELMAHYLYGHRPENVGMATGEVVHARLAYDGKALAEDVLISAGRNKEVKFLAHIIRPITDHVVPVMVLTQNGQLAEMPKEVTDALPETIWNKYTGPWGCIIEEEIVCERGYAIVEFNGNQLAYDGPEGLHGPAASAFPECDWGVIAIWSWGHSCILDYLSTTDWADKDKFVATGHSRFGKTALCAAIYDERYAVCAPTGSGCGGSGCFRFMGSRLGEGLGPCETAGSMNDLLCHFWSENFGEFGNRIYSHTRSTFPEGVDQWTRFLTYYGHKEALNMLGKTYNEDLLPFDMHFAKALIAPRGLVTSDAMSDAWANPFGIHVTWRAAQEVFDFLGVPENNAMYFREGGHFFDKMDWWAVADFCDKYFYEKEPKCYLQFVPHYPKELGMYETSLKNQDWRIIKLHYNWSNPLED